MTKETTETTTIINNYYLDAETSKDIMLELALLQLESVHDEAEEVWREIEFYPNYEVSNLGRVKSLDREVIYSNGRKRKYKGRVLKPYLNTKGYPSIKLSDDDGVSKKKYIHRLVLKAFNPIHNMDNLEVNHKDLNKCNNHITNLEWVTRQQNMTHAHSNGAIDYKKISGENNANAILTNEEVRDIVELYNNGSFKQCDIAEAFNVSRQTINGILIGKDWSKITGIKYKAKLSDEKAIQIILARRSGKSLRSVAEEFGVSIDTVRRLDIGLSREYLQDLI